MSDEALEFLLGGGAVAKFPEVGAKIVGKVLRYEKRQSKDMNGNLKFWDDGSAIYEIVVTLATDERDPEIEGDDGVRRLFVRGQMLNAVRDALRAASWRQSLVGGTLRVQHVGLGEQKRGFQPPKLYRAKFEPPTPVDDLDAMVGSDPSEFSEDPF